MTDNNQKVTVKIKNVYGRELVYPVCSLAQIFCTIAKSQTLTKENIKSIKELGYTVEVELQKL